MRDWKYMLYVAIAALMFVAVKLTQPKEYDWSFTLAHDDKNPYGTYALHTLFPDVFKEKVRHTYKTFYELKDSLQNSDNLIILASVFSPDPGDVKTILGHVASGGSALISANEFSGTFADTVGIRTQDNFFMAFGQRDSSYLHFQNPHLDSTRRFWFRKDNIHNFFFRFDTTRTTVVAMNDLSQPVTLRVAWGKGNLILSCTPMAFTNIYLLAGENQKYVSGVLSYLPAAGIPVRSEIYHVGRREVKTPLRFVLSQEPLAWAYYLVIGAILLFMLFEAKRKQRAIPIIRPLANTSLEFVATIGNLYYQKQNHKNIAEKKIVYLLDHIRTRYFLKINQLDEEFFVALSGKAGIPLEEVRSLFRAIHFIQSTNLISAGQLMDLNEKIESFNRQHQ